LDQESPLRNKAKNVFLYRSIILLPALLIGCIHVAASEATVASSSVGLLLPPLETSIQRSVPESISVGGVLRTYRLYVPNTFVPDHSALLIALHGRGAGGPGSAMEQYSQLDAKADHEGFAVAYLDGLVDATGTVDWNYYYDFFFSTGPDDIGFIRSVIDCLKDRLRPSARQIYVAGTSAGGFMAQRAGVELSDRVAAIGVVEGELYLLSPSSPASIPTPVEPVSVIFLKGDQDPNNQYCGAVFPSFSVTESSSDQDFDYWAGPSADSCEYITPQGSLCESVGVGDAQGHVTPGAASALTYKVATRCRRRTEVQLYRLQGGGDNWNLNPMNVPGAAPFNPELDRHTGVTTNDILWRFFREHAKRDGNFDWD
jgi:poly(3-hydroxybutyrate) depolymerase